MPYNRCDPHHRAEHNERAPSARAILSRYLLADQT
jgi:hypothetical protein